MYRTPALKIKLIPAVEQIKRFVELFAGLILFGILFFSFLKSHMNLFSEF